MLQSSKQNIKQLPLLESRAAMHSCAGWKLPKPFNQERVGAQVHPSLCHMGQTRAIAKRFYIG